jgi:hypothetical protein
LPHRHLKPTDIQATINDLVTIKLHHNRWQNEFYVAICRFLFLLDSLILWLLYVLVIAFVESQLLTLLEYNQQILLIVAVTP